MQRNDRNTERGGAMVAVLIMVIMAVAISAGVLLPAMSRSREARTALENERAFQVAEAGIDWAIAETRKRNGALPSTPTESGSPSSVGTFDIVYTAGTANGQDDDGDGLTDEADESDFIMLESTGRAGQEERTVQVLIRRAIQAPSLEAAVQINVESPIVDFNGNAFRIHGEDHDIAGNIDNTAPAKPGIASPAAPADIINQIPANRHGNVTGSGGSPSVSQVPAIDIALLAQQASSAATIVLGGGNHHGTYGTPTVGGTEIVYAPQNVKFAGGAGGAGILVVDGDLDISGGFEWVGIIIVRGAVNMTGGGGGKRLIGAVVVGEEISGSGGGSVRVTGTVDMLYSSAAVQMASQDLAVMSVLAWREVGTP